MERVVITGASAGIGAACVEAFRNEGVQVLGVDVQESSAAHDHLQLDLERADCGRVLADYCAGSRVDGLVNNAGISLDKLAVDTSAEEFDRVIAVNLRAPFLLSSALHPLLADSGGFVVNVASVHAVATTEMVASYASSKGGIVALTRALALEWAPQVRVNAVLPGAVDTRMLRRGLVRTQSSLDRLAERHPLKRVGTPSAVAEAIHALSRLSFVTGSTLTVDGGATAHLSTE